MVWEKKFSSDNSCRRWSRIGIVLRHNHNKLQRRISISGIAYEITHFSDKATCDNKDRHSCGCALSAGASFSKTSMLSTYVLRIRHNVFHRTSVSFLRVIRVNARITQEIVHCSHGCNDRQFSSPKYKFPSLLTPLDNTSQYLPRTWKLFIQQANLLHCLATD